MSNLNHVRRLVVLFMLTGLIVTACGLNFAAPVEEPVAPAAVEPELEGEEAPAPSGELTLVEKPASTEVVSAPAEEKLVIVADEAREEASLAAEPEVGAVAATPMPLPTATFGRDDDGLAAAGAPEMDRAEASMELAEFESAEEREAPIAQQVEPLKAGEVDDNAQWDDYLLYRRHYRGPWVHDRDVTERYVIEVEDAQGNPVLGATVRVFLPDQQQRQEIYSARTYANGQVLFHPRALADVPLEQVDRFIVEVQQDNLLQQFTLTRLEAQATTAFTERWTVSLDSLNQVDSLDLDV